MSDHSLTPVLPDEALARLRDGLEGWRSRRGLDPEALSTVEMLCRAAHAAAWSPEQLVIAVKDACRYSPELATLTTTSERDAFLGKIVSACIREFFRVDGNGLVST